MNDSDRIAADYIFAMAREVEGCCREKGWYDEDRSVGDMVALLHSEVSEVLEAYRDRKFEAYTREDGKPDDVASELADCLIRLLDMCNRWDVNLYAEFRRKMDYNWTRSYKHGGKTI